MSDQPEQLLSDSEQFALALNETLDVPVEEGRRKYEQFKYASVSIGALVLRMRTLVNCMGRTEAKLIFGIRPRLFTLWLERLPHHMEVLRADGYTEEELKLIFAGHLDLCRLEEARLKTRHQAFCARLPEAAHRRELVKEYPGIYQIKTDQLVRTIHLAWEGSAEQYWRRLHGTDKTDNRTKPDRLKKPVEGTQARLLGLLLYAGLERGFAEITARVFFNAFGRHAAKKYQYLLDEGWSAQDVHRLVVRDHKKWRSGLEKMVACERVFLKYGMNATEVRKFVMEYSIFCEEDAAKIEPALAALITVENAEFAIKALYHRPKSVFEDEGTIFAWHADMVKRKKMLIAHLHLLPNFTEDKRAIRLRDLVVKEPIPEPIQEPKQLIEPPQPTQKEPAKLPKPPAPPPKPPPLQLVPRIRAHEIEKAQKTAATEAKEMAAVISFKIRHPDEDVRMEIPVIKKTVEKMKAEDSRDDVLRAAHALSGNAVGMLKDYAFSFVLFRPELIEHSEKLMPMIQWLLAVGYKRNPLFDVVTKYTGILLIHPARLDHLVPYFKTRKAALPQDPRDILIPSDVFRSRESELQRAHIAPTDPRYHNALFARTNREFDNLLRS
ncbi:MAG: hypothetical protein ABIO72_02180 [Patescibacteria group bacterium]